jgi:hypothetical protein
LVPAFAERRPGLFRKQFTPRLPAAFRTGTPARKHRCLYEANATLEIAMDRKDVAHDHPDEQFMSRLAAIAGSDESETWRIARAIDLSNSYVADVKRRRNVGPRKRLSSRERVDIEHDLQPTRNEIARRERQAPDASRTARILKFARLAIELDSRQSNRFGEILKDELAGDHRNN